MTKLSAFGFSSGANDNSVSQPVSPKPPKNASTPVSATPSSQSTRKFMDKWKFNRPWLRYDPKSKLMFCDICVSAQVVNSFTSGCSMMKKECVTKHESKKGKTKFLFLICFFICDRKITAVYYYFYEKTQPWLWRSSIKIAHFVPIN